MGLVSILIWTGDTSSLMAYCIKEARIGSKDVTPVRLLILVVPMRISVKVRKGFVQVNRMYMIIEVYMILE